MRVSCEVLGGVHDVLVILLLFVVVASTILQGAAEPRNAHVAARSASLRSGHARVMREDDGRLLCWDFGTVVCYCAGAAAGRVCFCWFKGVQRMLQRMLQIVLKLVVLGCGDPQRDGRAVVCGSRGRRVESVADDLEARALLFILRGSAVILTNSSRHSEGYGG